MTTCPPCNGNCHQSDACPARATTETPLERRARIALPDLVLARMLDQGTIAGPYRPTHPLVLNAVVRIGRAVINAYTNRKSA
jgi:hypothetical protein